jgi:hypothetical protein
MFNKTRTLDIVFTDTLGVAEEYRPLPASQLIPDWYKKMPSYDNNKKTPTFGGTQTTIKKCIPVFDAITIGYLIVSYCDLHVSIVNGEPFYLAPQAIHPIESHPRKQSYKHPAANEFDFPKWKNAWSIKTPVGYSCLFIPPMHRPNERFTILEGVVDTDKYTAPVHFPFVSKTPSETFLIPAGTPIAQVIPFRRDEWKSSFSADQEHIKKVTKYATSVFFDKYKRMFWSRKSYS